MNTGELEGFFYKLLFTRTMRLRVELIGSFMVCKLYNYKKESMRLVDIRDNI